MRTVKQSLEHIKLSAQELIEEINRILKTEYSDEIYFEDVCNLYGHCEGIASAQRILEREFDVIS